MLKVETRSTVEAILRLEGEDAVGVFERAGVEPKEAVDALTQQAVRKCRDMGCKLVAFCDDEQYTVPGNDSDPMNIRDDMEVRSVKVRVACEKEPEDATCFDRRVALGESLDGFFQAVEGYDNRVGAVEAEHMSPAETEANRIMEDARTALAAAEDQADSIISQAETGLEEVRQKVAQAFRAEWLGDQQ